MNILGVPITLVTGFLGSGKTTLINNILGQLGSRSEEVAIIVNEFGEVGVDHQLMIQAEEEIFQLNNGCICCSLRSDLAESLAAIGRYFEEKDKTLRHVIIETTGIADPAPILQTISLSPILSQAFRFDSVLTLIDCLNFDQILLNYEEFYQQIAYADRFILSKADQISDDQLDQIKVKLSEINPLADYQIFSIKENFPVAQFFDLGLFQRVLNPEDHGEVCEHCGHHHDHGESCDHDHHHHDHHDHHDHDDHQHDHEHTHHHGHDHNGFMSLVMKTDQMIQEDLFLQWLDWLLMTTQGQLYRYKGLMNLKDRDLMVALQGVNLAYQFDLTAYPIEEYPSQIVLIGKELDESLIRLAFDELVQMSAS